MESKKKMKKPNFSSIELDVMISGIEANINIINSTLTNTVTNNLKKKSWTDITNKVNSVSKTVRNEDEIRKKWTDLKGQTKKAEAARRGSMKKTGGGPPPEDLSSLENRVLQLIPSCLIEGIQGGKETPIAVSSVEEIIAEPALASEAEPTPSCSKASDDIEDFFTPYSPQSAEFREEIKVSGSGKVRGPKKRPVTVTEESTNEIYKTLSHNEGKKIQIFEDILGQLQLLIAIQRERLNLEKEKFEYKQSKDYSLSPIIKFD